MSVETGQYTLDLFPESEKAIPAPRVSPEQVTLPEVPPSVARLKSELGTRATAESLIDKPHYELGGGVAEAVAEQDADTLTPFAEFIETYTPNKREVAALFEQYRFPDITPDLLFAMPPQERGKLSAHVVEYVEHLQRRGRVLATEGTYGGALAESYDFADEQACLDYGQELMNLSHATKEQPTFSYLAASAQAFLSDREPFDTTGHRYPATAVSRRQFVAADTRRRGKPQVTLTTFGAQQQLGLSYESLAK